MNAFAMRILLNRGRGIKAIKVQFKLPFGTFYLNLKYAKIITTVKMKRFYRIYYAYGSYPTTKIINQL
jgi:hypothetical protein